MKRLRRIYEVEKRSHSLQIFLKILKAYFEGEEEPYASSMQEQSAKTNDASSPRVGKDANILSWLKLHESTYSVMLKMALDIFSIIATSVLAERLFWKASLIIRKHWNNLNKDSAKSLLYLISWLTSDLTKRIHF